MLSKNEWRTVAERAAAAKHGERNADWLHFKRFGAARLGVVVALGAVGLGARWLWLHLLGPLFSGEAITGHVPAGFWLVVAICLLLSILALRSRVLSLPPFAIARGIVIAFLWLGLGAYLLSCLT